jgi:hypothetical protein
VMLAGSFLYSLMQLLLHRRRVQHVSWFVPLHAVVLRSLLIAGETASASAYDQGPEGIELLGTIGKWRCRRQRVWINMCVCRALRASRSQINARDATEHVMI